jgi:hypothetical protein
MLREGLGMLREVQGSLGKLTESSGNDQGMLREDLVRLRGWSGRLRVAWGRVDWAFKFG